MAVIKDAILIRDKIAFTELFEENITKSEMINIFLAVLELLKQQVISIKQENIFDDIEIIKHEEGETNE